jgi:hypothetical protein
VDTRALKLGGSYRLSLQSQAHHAAPSFSQVFQMNMGPFGGQVSVSPLKGKALVTGFHLAAMKWDDTELPLTYAFWRRNAIISSGAALKTGLEAVDTMLLDWSPFATVLIPLPAGTIQILSRARDNLGTESVVSVLSPAVQVEEVILSDVELDSFLRALTSATTESARLLGTVDVIAGMFESRTNISSNVTDAAIRCMRKGQQMLRGKGSRAGAVHQASMLAKITGAGNIFDDPHAGSTRSAAAAVLDFSLTSWENSASATDPVGMPRKDAEEFVRAASNVVSLQKPGNFSIESLPPSALDGNVLERVARVIGHELARNILANTPSISSHASSIQAARLSVGAYLYTWSTAITSTTTLPPDPSVKALTSFNTWKLAKELDVSVAHVGEFRMSVADLSSISTNMQAMGYEPSSVTSIVSAHRWAGNPFGPSQSNSFATEGAVVSYSLRSEDGPSATSTSLSSPILLKLPMVGQNFTYLRQQLLSGMFPQCRFWDPLKLQWAGDGCRILDVRKKGSEMLCSCTHLTSFGAFTELELYPNASNVDPPTASDEDEKKGNPMLWLLGLIFAFEFLWISTAWCRDLGRYHQAPEDIVWRMHFRDDPLYTQAVNSKRTQKDVDEDEEQFNLANLKKFETGPDRLILFLRLFRVMRTLQHFGYRDLMKAGVREDIMNSYRSELTAITEEQQEVLRQELHGFASARAAFRDPRIFRRLKDVLEEVTHVAILNKRHRAPELPWSCSGFFSVSCHGVHPWEGRKNAQKLLGVDALIPVYIQLDEYGLCLYEVEKKVELPWQGIPPTRWFQDHKPEPFMVASWSAVSDHEAVREREVAAKLVESRDLANIQRFEERLERMAAGNEQPEKRDARVLEICDEYDRHIVNKRWGSEQPYASTAFVGRGSEESGSATDESFRNMDSEAGLAGGS